MKRMNDEDFIKIKGWHKVKGWKINLEELSNYDNFDYLYVTDLEDWVEDCEFWMNDDFDEEGYEEIDDIIEKHYDEYMDKDGNVYDEPVNEGWFEMSKGSRIRKNKYRGINTSIIAETIKEIKPKRKKKSKRENDLE